MKMRRSGGCGAFGGGGGFPRWRDEVGTDAPSRSGNATQTASNARFSALRGERSFLRRNARVRPQNEHVCIRTASFFGEMPWFRAVMLYFMRERKHFVHEIKHYAHEISSFSCESRSFVLVRSSFTRERSYSEDEMLSFTDERSSFGCERSSFVGERLHSGRERLSFGGGIKHSVRERSLRGGEMLYRRAVRFPSRCESLLPDGLPASVGVSAILCLRRRSADPGRGGDRPAVFLLSRPG